jgi:23S rRNA (uracil1939-C5)-methyltransferase
LTPSRASTPAADALHDVRIERLAAGGDGVAHLDDGMTVFVPLTAPGDLVTIRLTTRRKRFARGVIDTLIEAGPGRREARCGVFGSCGGCTWQHLDYACQLDSKREILTDALQRIGHLELSEAVEVAPSPQEFAYRGRARLLVRDREVGYRARGSHALCAIDRCPVLAPALERALVARAAALQGAPQGVPCEWHIDLGSDGSVATRETQHEASRVLDDGPQQSVALAIGDEMMTVSSGSFAQANHLMLDTLSDAVVSAVTRSSDAPRDGTLLELHAGVGYFTLALARCFGRIHAVESGASAVRDLRRNLAIAGHENVDVIHSRVERWLGRPASTAYPRPDVVLLDPPRSGLRAEIANGLADLGASRIVYVSCDAATLARDLKVLCSRGYRLERVRGFDLFPQTPHVEALAVLAL